MGNGYFMEDQTLFATTDMAWLVGEDEADATWVPQSVILNTDIDEIDQVGYLEVEMWWAKKRGLES